MTISYTTYHNFPLLDDGAKNSGAVHNGIFEDIDLLIAQLEDPVCDYDGTILVDSITGETILSKGVV